PAAGTNYIYLSDAGGAKEETSMRNQIRIVRFPEPAVSPEVPASAPTVSATGVEVFNLTYPDGSYDSEALLVDPLTADLFIVTKESSASRIYSVNLNAAAAGSTTALTFAGTVDFPVPSGATVSADGSQIIIRNEDQARLWNRQAGESIPAALTRPPVAIPVIGTPAEPNGEAVAFLRDDSGYLTISEGELPVLYYFAAQCPRAPAVAAPLADQTVLAGSTVVLEAHVSGEPPPTFSWKFNGQPIAGQTASTLTVPNFQSANAGTYELTAANSLGSVTTSAVISVRTMLNLRVTEVSSQQAAGGSGVADWWELTSFEPAPVTLAGWRFNDSGGGLGSAFVFPAGLTIPAGGSIIFVEDLTAEQFRAWWGASVPAAAQIVTYSGNGLAFSASDDGVRLWNATATEDADTVASVDFAQATAGVTFNYDPVSGQFGALSQAGVNGVFKAATTADIGSPGLYRAAVPAPVLTIAKSATGIRIDFTTVPGGTYVLEFSVDPVADTWEPTGDTFTATNDEGGFFEVPISGGRSFYRVRVE
ncbi:MAG: hypothetical protein EOP86_24200, partial [Verrucomicrobiaceae bacterium]